MLFDKNGDSRNFKYLKLKNLAPRARFELATLRLTAECSTVELPGSRATEGEKFGGTSSFSLTKAHEGVNASYEFKKSPLTRVAAKNFTPRRSPRGGAGGAKALPTNFGRGPPGCRPARRGRACQSPRRGNGNSAAATPGECSPRHISKTRNHRCRRRSRRTGQGCRWRGRA